MPLQRVMLDNQSPASLHLGRSMLRAYWLIDADEIDALGIKRQGFFDTQQYLRNSVDAIKVSMFDTRPSRRRFTAKLYGIRSTGHLAVVQFLP